MFFGYISSWFCVQASFVSNCGDVQTQQLQFKLYKLAVTVCVCVSSIVPSRLAKETINCCVLSLLGATLVEKWIVFIHLTEFSFWNNPPWKVTSETLKLFTSRFPEFLGPSVL